MKTQDDPMARLSLALQKLPGIGAKSAQRLAFHFLKVPREDVDALAAALVDMRDAIRFCSSCCNITSQDPCVICDDANRDRSMLCVVEEPANVGAIEKTGRYRGVYHVLHGALSPMHGIGPEHLKIPELMRRLPGLSEVILATNPNADGESTAVYLAGLIKRHGVQVSRIGMGLPVGAELDYVDDATLSRALEGRRKIQG